MNRKPTVRERMIALDREVLEYAQGVVQEEGAWYPMVLGHSWRNAVERLEEKGLLRYSSKKMGYVLTQKGRASLA